MILCFFRCKDATEMAELLEFCERTMKPLEWSANNEQWLVFCHSVEASSILMLSEFWDRYPVIKHHDRFDY